MRHFSSSHLSFMAAIALAGAALCVGGCRPNTGTPPTQAQLQQVQQKNMQTVQDNPNIPPEQKEHIKALMSAHHGPPQGAKGAAPR